MAVTGLAVVAAFRYLTSFSGSESHSCQAITGYVSDWRFGAGIFLGIMTLSLILKILATALKASQSHQRLLRNQLPLPAKLQAVLHRLQLPRESILAVNIPGCVAVTTGWLQPKILLSPALIARLSPRQLEAVVLHEQYHQLHRHPLTYVWLEIVTRSLWFWPSLSEVKTYALLELEQQADAAAIKVQGTARHLRLALAKVLESSQVAPEYAIWPQILSGPAEVLTQRIASLTQPESPSQQVPKLRLQPLKLTMTLTVALVLLKLILSPVQAATSVPPSMSHCDFWQCATTCAQRQLMSQWPDSDRRPVELQNSTLTNPERSTTLSSN